IKYNHLHSKGFTEQEALEFLELKRSTFYSWLKKFNDKCGTINMKTTELENKSRRPHNFRKSKIINHELISHILKIRQANPMYGKEKIKRELEKENVFVSVSTVGRILRKLMSEKKIENIKTLVGKNTGYRKEQRKRYAQRIGKQKPENPGELIQIDHMVLNLYNGLKIKEFRATDPTTRLSISRIYSSANAVNAREFLKEVIYEFEFEIKSIQVDGGSEFMAEFEDYCEEKGIKLYVLPPRSPKMNGYVERTNETYRYEFWNVYEIPDTIEETRKLLRKFEIYYNCERMHQSLNYLTPMEYYYTIKNKSA
ncbi:MAG: integrase core domain-containing protein, partial [Candidatus Gastranaerophilales bacterium]|nr:integrase core domain-containing protein [Candidatus Gastranaerophilales bacterium]